MGARLRQQVGENQPIEFREVHPQVHLSSNNAMIISRIAFKRCTGGGRGEYGRGVAVKRRVR